MLLLCYDCTHKHSLLKETMMRGGNTQTEKLFTFSHSR